MGKNYFTQEQQSELRKNAYIEKVSEKSITYTKELKKNLKKNIALENYHHKFWLIWGLIIAYLERNGKDSSCSPDEVI